MKPKKNKYLLSTLGPSSLNEHVISRLTDLGVDLFRINLSHTKIVDLSKVIDLIKSFTTVPICLDTEGAQVRTGSMKNKLSLKNNDKLIIKRKVGTGRSNWFNLYPYTVFDQLEIGDILNIDFNSVMAQVIKKNFSRVVIRIISSGEIDQNKAVTFNKSIDLRPLTEKDLLSLKIGIKSGINDYALSFANTKNDVKYLRSIIGQDARIISKIESIQGLKNLKEISIHSDAILIDRGDLSREIPIENIPSAQKYIIKTVKEDKNNVYVATNFLESMINSVGPTRAEINDIHNTLVDGADGLVLAAETAIGNYPIQCATIISKMISQFEISSNNNNHTIDDLIKKESTILPKPHGGELVNQVIDQNEDFSFEDFVTLTVDISTMMDVEQIAIGTFSPLTGFMCKEEIESVLDDYKLLNGVIWPMPIYFQLDNDYFSKLKIGDYVLLQLKGQKSPLAIITVEQKFKMDLNVMSLKMFNTNNIKHPGVKVLFEKGDRFISGKVELISRIPSKYKYYEITPFESRQILEYKGWSRVVGFHTRNIPHRVHEYIQKLVLENYLCDGLFIHPAIGPKKSGDYLPNIIMESYQILIDNFLSQSSILAAFQSYSRYAGPREAVFTALCRKNFGCSHFIIGRDHTGIGEYYSNNDLKNLFSQIEDIDILPIILDEYVYSEEKGDYVELSDAKDARIKTISGTMARKMLKNGEIPPAWYMRKEISNYIIELIKSGNDVFIS